MGSSKAVTTPATDTMEHKKSIRSIFTKNIQKVIAPWKGHKELKKETKEEITKHVDTETIDVQKLIVDNFNKLMIEKERESKKEVEDNDEFSYSTVKDDDNEGGSKVEKKTERTDSHVSRDSGFSEKDCNDEETEKKAPDDDKSKSDEIKTASKKEDKFRVRSNSVGVAKSAKSVLATDEKSNKEERVRTQSERSVISKEEQIVVKSLSNLKIDGDETKRVISKGDEEVVESLSKLKIEDGRKKKLQTVAVSRGPVLNKRAPKSHPYSSQSFDAQGKINQINQVNTKTFSGGQVIYNAPRLDDKTPRLNDNAPDIDDIVPRLDDIAPRLDDNAPRLNNIDNDFAEVDIALGLFKPDVLHFPKNPEQRELALQLAQEIILEDTDHPITEETLPIELETHPLAGFESQVEIPSQDHPINVNIMSETQNSPSYPAFIDSDPIGDFYAHELFPNLPDSTPTLWDLDQPKNGYAFPTPPRSDHVPSPNSMDSLYPSPAMPSPCETYQEILPYDDMIPSCVSEHIDDVIEKKDKPRERNVSTSSATSSMTMKQYKDLQKELAMGFSKKECCQAKIKSTKEIFCEHTQRLPMKDREAITLKVAGMELNHCYGTLQNILMKLQNVLNKKESEREPKTDALEKYIVMFRVICDRLLGESPATFVGEDGLYLLLAACLRCPSLPLLTRYLVECVRVVLHQQPTLAVGEFVFTQVDKLGYNLVSTCARVGDVCADVLYELVNRKPEEKPMFDVNQCNTEGNSALHVACKHHSADNTCLHVAHVLLEHAGADLWMGNKTAGDTALHLAVNSATCDLKMVMVLFKHVDRKKWYDLAHFHKQSKVSAMDYARSAIKSRPDYPKEILDFFKKCRRAQPGDK